MRHNWREFPGSAKKMFEVFLIMRQLHELIWYLLEGLTLEPTGPIQDEVSLALKETEGLTHLNPEDLMRLDVAAHQANIGVLLRQISDRIRGQASDISYASLHQKKILDRRTDFIGADLKKKNLKGASLRGAFLIAADLKGADLSFTDLIGADLRDTDLRGADLAKSIFLTQAQINVAKGDNSTKLPPSINRPIDWSSFT